MSSPSLSPPVRDRAQLVGVVCPRVRDLAHQPERRRRHEGIPDPVPRHEGEGPVRVEFRARRADHRHAVIERGKQHVEQSAGPCPVGGRPEPVAGLRKELMRHHHAGQVAEEDALGVQGALGVARRAGGVHEQCRIVGARIGGRRGRGRALQQAPEIARARLRTIADGQDVLHALGVADRLRVALEGLRRGDEDPRGAVAQAIADRIRSEQREHRQGDGAELLDGDMRDQHFGALRQVDADDRAAPDAQIRQHVGTARGAC